MRHVEKALKKMQETNNLAKFVTIKNCADIKGQAPIISFEIQSDPIGLVGLNGCQATDILEYTKHLFESLNDSFPCRENALTITKIEEALHWQEARGQNQKSN